jgi:hypothetical protein
MNAIISAILVGPASHALVCHDETETAKSASFWPDACATDMLTMLLLALVIVILGGQNILRVQRQPTS